MKRIQIDRKNYYRLVPNLYFPIHDDPTFSHFHCETLIDGELVNDIESDGSVSKSQNLLLLILLFNIITFVFFHVLGYFEAINF